MEKKKILVIDDNPENINAAKVTLVDHDLTVISSHEEALKLLAPYSGNDPELDFDIMVTDLLMPVSGRNQRKYSPLAGTEMPVGFQLALLGAKVGIPEIMILTDTNHHDHPASAMLDPLGKMTIEKSTVRFVHCSCMRGRDPLNRFPNHKSINKNFRVELLEVELIDFNDEEMVIVNKQQKEYEERKAADKAAGKKRRI